MDSDHNNRVRNMMLQKRPNKLWEQHYDLRKISWSIALKGKKAKPFNYNRFSDLQNNWLHSFHLLLACRFAQTTRDDALKKL